VVKREMSITLEWILGILIVIFSGLLGAVYSIVTNHGKRIAAHDVLFATFAGMDKKIDELGNALEKHEEKEDKQFQDITHRLERLTINVSLLKKAPVNGDE
jgi:hypothetical protein